MGGTTNSCHKPTFEQVTLVFAFRPKQTKEEAVAPAQFVSVVCQSSEFSGHCCVEP